MQTVMQALSSEPPEQLLHALINAIEEFIVLKDGQGRWLFANRIVIDTYGLHGVDYIGKTDGELALCNPVFKDAFAYNMATDELAWAKGTAFLAQKPFRGRDGCEHTWEVVKTPYFDALGNRRRLVIVSRNITERRAVEAALQASERKYRLIAERMSDLIGMIDRDGRLQYVSPSFEHVLGFRAEAMLERSLLGWVHDEDRPALQQVHRALLARQIQQGKVEYRFRDEADEYHWFEASISCVLDAAGEIEHIIHACRDIGERKQYDQYLKTIAYHDPLTGIPNRRRLMDRIQAQISGAQGVCFALLYLDLDRFKSINDSLGHAIGDELLIKFVQRIREHLRPEDFFARIGGDEFVILLPDTAVGNAINIAQRLCGLLQQTWMLSCGPLQTTSSIGVALYPEAGDSVYTLLRRADEAQYRAKRAGRACIRLFESD